MSSTPPTLTETLQLTERIYATSSHTLEGTRPGGPGEMALYGLAFTIEALRHAQEAVAASGESGI